MAQVNDFKKLFKLIENIEICMFTTTDEDGHLRSRPMATQSQYRDGYLWFLTRQESGKVDEVRHEGEVGLGYSDPDSNQYVSISGKAAVTQDREKIRELWQPAFKAWFPEGVDDPKIALIRVEIEKAEFWSSPSSVVVQLVGFTKAVLTGKAYHGGDHGKIDAIH